jgi:hypothetical protein
MVTLGVELPRAERNAVQHGLELRQRGEVASSQGTSLAATARLSASSAQSDRRIRVNSQLWFAHTADVKMPRFSGCGTPPAASA